MTDYPNSPTSFQPALQPTGRTSLLDRLFQRIDLDRLSVVELLLLLAAHMVLAAVARESSLFSAGVATLTLGLGIWLALKRSTPDRILMVCMYIAGAEVFWRATLIYHYLFWESGKYFIVFVLLVAILRERITRLPALPLLGTLLLVPSAVMIVGIVGVSSARDQISSELIGYVVLFAMAVYCSNHKLTLKQLRNILFAFLLPAVSMATLGLIALFTYDIVWTNESNTIASGDFGANQVSTLLGLAVLIIIALLLLLRNRRTVIVLLPLMIWLTAQTLLTFSRGGIYNTLIALAAGLPTLLRLQMSRLLIILVAGMALFALLIPQLDVLTEGMFSRRYTNLNPTGRVELVEEQLEVFLDHPLLGVGTGLWVRYSSNPIISNHTEYTRLISEHGLLGIGVIVVWSLSLLVNYRRLRHLPLTQAVMAMFIVWAAVYMTHAAMRTAAPSMLFGLTFATYGPDPTEPEADTPAAVADETYEVLNT